IEGFKSEAVLKLLKLIILSSSGIFNFNSSHTLYTEIALFSTDVKTPSGRLSSVNNFRIKRLLFSSSLQHWIMLIFDSNPFFFIESRYPFILFLLIDNEDEIEINAMR